MFAFHLLKTVHYNSPARLGHGMCSHGALQCEPEGFLRGAKGFGHQGENCLFL